MRSFTKSGSSLLAGLLMTTTLATAQPKTLTLEQAKQTALERNLNVVQAQNSVESAQARALAARGEYLPSVSASANWNRYQNDSPGASSIVLDNGQIIPGSSGFSVNNSFSTGVNLNYTIFDGFRREGNVGAATSSAVASEYTSARARQSVVYQTESAYVTVLRNEQLVKVSEENLKRDRRQLERITEANRVGALSLADVYRQQSQVAEDELDLIRTQNEYDKSKADFVSLIGLDAFEEFQFSDPELNAQLATLETATPEQQTAGLNELTQRAIAARPDYLSAQQNYEATESGVSSARAGYLPTIGASAGYSLSNRELSRISDNKSLNWGIGIRWTLFDGFATNQSLQSAIVERRNAEVSVQQAQRDINVQIKKALLDLEAARKAVDVSKKGLRSAQEDLKIAEERYNLGAGTLLDLLTASAGYVSAQANKVNAAYGYIIAQRNLEYTIGDRSY
ncbi:MAG: TolC family protein [Bacteroidota bacterium]